MNTDDLNKVIDKLYDFMADDLSDPKGGWIHGPTSFLPANVCCDFAGMARFKKKLYDILAHEFIACEMEATEKAKNRGPAEYTNIRGHKQ